MKDKKTSSKGTSDKGSTKSVGNKRAGYVGPGNPKAPTSQQIPKNPPKKK